MSRSHRTLKRARARRVDRPPAPVTTLRDPGDVIAMIPYVLGFRPADSLVVVALQGPHHRLGPTLRVDLPHDGDEGVMQARYLCGVIGAHRLSPVLLVAFTANSSRADAVLQPLRRELALRRVTVCDALRADGRRWWSYTCHDPLCCSPEGTPYDAEASRVAAEAVAAGLPRAPDRDALRAGLQPASVRAREELAHECTRLAGAYATGALPRPGVADLERSVLRHRRAPSAMSATETAMLLLAVQAEEPRDAVLALMTRDDAADHLALWRQVLRNAPDELLAPAGALTGLAAWLDGQGALAWHAVERVEAVTSGYPPCGLLRRILEGAVSPEIWDLLGLGGNPGR